jgi:hypothetical protein
MFVSLKMSDPMAFAGALEFSINGIITAGGGNDG